jgi:hypothetical protein
MRANPNTDSQTTKKQLELNSEKRMESHNDKIQSQASVGPGPSDANFCCDAWRAFSSSVRPYLHHQLTDSTNFFCSSSGLMICSLATAPSSFLLSLPALVCHGQSIDSNTHTAEYSSTRKNPKGGGGARI